jgi:hypothetical protein
LKCYRWNIALYGAATLALRKADQKYLERFKIWCWRRLEKIIWTERCRTEHVNKYYTESRRKKKHPKYNKTGKANVIGHTLHRKCLLKHVTDGKINETRGQGRRGMQLVAAI